MPDTSNTRVYGIVVTVLLVLSAAIGWFFWQKSQAMLANQDRLESERLELQAQKQTLERSLDSLAVAYADLRTENENLVGQVNVTSIQIEAKDRELQALKSKSAETIDQLRDQVKELERIEIEYGTIVGVLRQENEMLKNENASLKAEAQTLRGEREELNTRVAELGKQLEEQIRKVQSATFKATSFRAEVQRRNEKLTTKARRARDLQVSFDLVDVPATYQGAQKLYLAITDHQGTPIISENPTSATVYAPSGPVGIIAQQVKPVVLETTQRLSFSYKFDERLRPGVYVVAIYCDKGLLGAHSFRLN
jgi:hypothetical protein